MQELDRLEDKLEEVGNVCIKIKGLRQRCDQLGGRMDNTMLSRAGGGGSTSGRTAVRRS